MLRDDLEVGTGGEHLGVDPIETDEDRLGAGDRLDEVLPGFGMILGPVVEVEAELVCASARGIRLLAERRGEDGEAHQAPISIPKVSNTV
ncbi:hypothetical protein GCM10010974_18660 [Brevibacterium sediminis]|uniref:Uncharacterized protein n=1 Tax=Brevibacterium sediminis TaxID=1857024 RepID=A0ABQ1M8J2_9MICO|nr:hypothetical protein GCM10010974_18660 [Brevibacterium sediminis]